jgi:hypothetical protein
MRSGDSIAGYSAEGGRWAVDLGNVCQALALSEIDHKQMTVQPAHRGIQR